MNRPRELLLTTCLAAISVAAAAAEDVVVSQDLRSVKNSEVVTAARWSRTSDSYVLMVGLDRYLAYNPNRRTTVPPALPATVVTAPMPTASISAEELQRLGIINVADALAQLVPQRGSYMPDLTGNPDPQGMDRSQLFIARTIANLRSTDPSSPCARQLTTDERRRMVRGESLPPAPSPLNQPYPPSQKERRVEVWLLKADGTLILPAGYSCDPGPAAPAPRNPSIEISYSFPLADGAMAVAAAIRVGEDFFIEKLQPPGP